MSTRYLFIAEKPSSMRAFHDVYVKHKSEIDGWVDGTIDFTALRGHIFRNLEPVEYEQWNKKWAQLYESDLPMVPDTWKLTEIDTARDAVKKLKEELKKGYDGIIVGTDADVEGYGIYYMVYQALNLKKYKTLRFYETALTEKNILQSYKDMSDLYTTPMHKNAMNSYIFRSRWDWLIGMNFTVAYTVRFGQLMKVGSVKAPTLKLIYDNCYAIDNFKEMKSYGIKSDFADGFSANLINDDNANDKLFDKKEDAEALNAVLAMSAKVIEATKKTTSQKAPKLYSLSDLQIDAAKAPFGYTPDETLAIAQKLYEERKILTYPRTSGNYLASGKVSDLPDIIKSITVIPDISSFASGVTTADFKRVAADKNIINDKEVEKAAHDALIPTGNKVDWDTLTKPEKDIFLLVCKRLLAHFLPCFTEEKTTVILDNNGNRFKADGRRTVENGFNDLYGKKVADVELKEYKEGTVLDIKTNEVFERVSAPPKRYSTGTIIHAMKNIASQVTDIELKKVMKESEGIGTEATRAGIITELEKSGYIETKKNMIYITQSGKDYIEHLRRKTGEDTYDYGIAEPVKVAYWSAKAKEIQLGNLGVKDVLDEFLVYLNETTHDIKASGDPVKNIRGSNGKDEDLPVCPICGGKVASGKFGYYCKDYKTNGCKLSIPNEMAGKTLTDNQKLQLLNGKTIHAKGFKSKSGNAFEADVKLNKETGRCEFDFSNNPKKK